MANVDIAFLENVEFVFLELIELYFRTCGIVFPELVIY